MLQGFYTTDVIVLRTNISASMDFYTTLVYVFFIQLSIKSRLGSTSSCIEVASTVGSSFVFGVPSKLIGTNEYIYIHITAVSGVPTLVNITAPFINYNNQFTVFNSTIVTLNQSLVNMEEAVHFTGIEVVSKANISVVVNIYSTSITEGFLVLPTSALSTRYIAASYQPCRSCNSSVIVIGTEDSTTVSIKYKTNGQAKTSFQNFTLKKLESYQLTANSDLSGAVLISSKPVAVLSGVSISRVPVAIGNNNYAMEQMIPTKYWVNEYIVPPIYPYNYFIVRIFVDEGDTDVSFINSTRFIKKYFEKESMYEVMFGTDPAFIMATKPISVFQYYVDNENINGSIYMTTVQGISQYVNSYRFNTETFSGIYSTVALTVMKSSLHGINLNGRNLSSWITKTVPVSPPMADYITVFISIPYNSFFILDHVDGMKFGATLYGIVMANIVYGFPLQLYLFSKSECVTSSAAPDVADISTNHLGIATNSFDTIPSRCKDTETDCADYGFDYICLGSYIPWSAIHCAEFCNLCPELATDRTTTLVTSTLSSSSHYEISTANGHADPNSCQDKDEDCAIYGFDYICRGDYIPWSTIHCAKFCNLCPGSTSEATTVKTELTTQPTVMQTKKTTTTPTTVSQALTTTTPTTPTTVLQTSIPTTASTTALQTPTTTLRTVLQTSKITTQTLTSDKITTYGITLSHNTATFLTNSSLMCYSCSDMSQLELCDVVHRCKDSEICFVERYWQYDRHLFRSGCMEKDICHRNEISVHNIPGRCVQCCDEAFCNHQGCGDPGLPDKPHRGPICFDCPYESSALNCTKVTVCENGEFCSIQEFRLWGEHVHFILGCSHGQCQQSLPASHVLTRSALVCSECCYDDYCNNNCTKPNDSHQNVIPVG